ncbi:hypothetical protein SAMN04489760_10827 [Syntrophus gentianae]|uniref:DUF5132 domain-containing protein n=1 Tax=Syntrophus gentianae TaxID=43775 RepID=A0A1H7WVH7_9BACT|nr:DUF5132 domain-containing protein [Syntrophus gentianae]SEM25384.1 hypothetical protein SAMN04489760_10827 [Syntrophus gentianae]
MALGNYIKGNVGAGLLVGVGALLLAPVVLPALAGIVKTTTKAVVKTGATLYEKGSETVMELGKIASDFVAETKQELARDKDVIDVESSAVPIEPSALTEEEKAV